MATGFLTGKNALVTGSTSGIGLAIAHELAAEGANIVLNGFGDPADIEKIRQELVGAYGVSVLYHGADLSLQSEVEALVAFAKSELGCVDILVNNAGIQHVSPVEDFPPQTWDKVLAINLSSVFHTIRLTLPDMKQRGFGRIINVASAHGHVASTYKAAYVAAKHGVIGLTKVVGLETATTPVTCNAVCPGWVLTPLVQKQIDDRVAQSGGKTEAEIIEQMLGEKQPSKAFVTTEQLGKLCVFLCSDAASQVRGASWNMDGGWLAQ